MDVLEVAAYLLYRESCGVIRCYESEMENVIAIVRPNYRAFYGQFDVDDTGEREWFRLLDVQRKLDLQLEVAKLYSAAEFALSLRLDQIRGNS